MQHDVFTWNIDRDEFEIIEEISAKSNHVELKIKNLTNQLNNCNLWFKTKSLSILLKSFINIMFT